jgi:uncharacterized protein YndB with AHSA1/START domain
MAEVVDFRVPPIALSVHVACSPSDAFDRFTRHMAAWWPIQTHSVSGDAGATCGIEGWVGGRVWERDRAGTEHVWGNVLEFDPPRALTFTWHPGVAPSDEQTVRLTFEPDGDGCRVVLTHAGWDARPAEQRERYKSGWGFVLGQRFVGDLAAA